MIAETHIPIPSQKRGICLADAMSATIWYTDEIRDFLWEWCSDKEIDSDCDRNAFRLSNEELVSCWLKLTALRVTKIFLDNPSPPRSTPQMQRNPSAPLDEFGVEAPVHPGIDLGRIEILDLIDGPIIGNGVLLPIRAMKPDSSEPGKFSMSSSEIIRIEFSDRAPLHFVAPDRYNPVTNRVKYLDRGDPEKEVPLAFVEPPASIDVQDLGELCSLIYNAYRTRLEKNISSSSLFTVLSRGIETRDDFGVPVDHMLTPSLFNSTFQLFREDTTYACSNMLPEGATPLAIVLPKMPAYYLNNTEEGSRHAVTICKINGRWHFLDNNVGFSIPFMDPYNNDIFVINNRFKIRSNPVENGTEFRIFTFNPQNTEVTEPFILIGTPKMALEIRHEGPLSETRFFIFSQSTPTPAPAPAPAPVQEPLGGHGAPTPAPAATETFSQLNSPVKFPDTIESKIMGTRNVRVEKSWSVRYPLSTYSVETSLGGTQYIQRVADGNLTVRIAATGEEFRARYLNQGGNKKTYRKKTNGTHKKTRKQ
jgi:hypothetical protein